MPSAATLFRYTKEDEQLIHLLCAHPNKVRMEAELILSKTVNHVFLHGITEVMIECCFFFLPHLLLNVHGSSIMPSLQGN